MAKMRYADIPKDVSVDNFPSLNVSEVTLSLIKYSYLCIYQILSIYQNCIIKYFKCYIIYNYIMLLLYIPSSHLFLNIKCLIFISFLDIKTFFIILFCSLHSWFKTNFEYHTFCHSLYKNKIYIVFWNNLFA